MPDLVFAPNNGTVLEVLEQGKLYIRPYNVIGKGDGREEGRRDCRDGTRLEQDRYDE